MDLGAEDPLPADARRPRRSRVVGELGLVGLDVAAVVGGDVERGDELDGEDGPAHPLLVVGELGGEHAGAGVVADAGALGHVGELAGADHGADVGVRVVADLLGELGPHGDAEAALVDHAHRVAGAEAHPLLGVPLGEVVEPGAEAALGVAPGVALGALAEDHVRQQRGDLLREGGAGGLPELLGQLAVVVLVVLGRLRMRSPLANLSQVPACWATANMRTGPSLSCGASRPSAMSSRTSLSSETSRTLTHPLRRLL